MLKKFVLAASGIICAGLVLVSGGESVNAGQVGFETFVNSVKSGEFVLSKKINDEFTSAINDGNTDRAMEIYRDFFDGDNTDGIAYAVSEPASKDESEDDEAAGEAADTSDKASEAADKASESQETGDEAEASDAGQAAEGTGAEQAAADQQSVSEPAGGDTASGDTGAGDGQDVRLQAVTEARQAQEAKAEDEIERERRAREQAASEALAAKEKADAEAARRVEEAQEARRREEEARKAEVKAAQEREAARRAEIEAQAASQQGGAPASAPKVSLSDAEYNALCKIVYAEAHTQGEEGMLLIANVILNRVASHNFPSSVTGVISQPGQFAPVYNGRYATAVPNAAAISAVNRALAGENHAGSSLYFKSSRSSQSWGSRNLVMNYGNHSFYN